MTYTTAQGNTRSLTHEWGQGSNLCPHGPWSDSFPPHQEGNPPDKFFLKMKKYIYIPLFPSSVSGLLSKMMSSYSVEVWSRDWKDVIPGVFLWHPCMSTGRCVRPLSISKVSLFHNLVTKVELPFFIVIIICSAVFSPIPRKMQFVKKVKCKQMDANGCSKLISKQIVSFQPHLICCIVRCWSQVYPALDKNVYF